MVNEVLQRNDFLQRGFHTSIKPSSAQEQSHSTRTTRGHYQGLRARPQQGFSCEPSPIHLTLCYSLVLLLLSSRLVPAESKCLHRIQLVFVVNFQLLSILITFHLFPSQKESAPASNMTRKLQHRSVVLVFLPLYSTKAKLPYLRNSSGGGRLLKSRGRISLSFYTPPTDLKRDLDRVEHLAYPKTYCLVPSFIESQAAIV